jgi:hypothetical protein
MMGMELVPETLIFNQLTWLITQEDFINVHRRESFRSYITTMFKRQIMYMAREEV